MDSASNAGSNLFPMDMQPHLVGPLLELRPLGADDFEAVYAAASDPLICEQHPDPLRYRADQFQEWWRGAMETKALAVIDRATGKIIGSTRFLSYTGDEVEIGWTFLARRYWGGRYNGEMKRLMLEHAFKHVARVVFLVGPRNRRSQRAVEKIGAIRTGMRRNAAGKEQVLFELTPERLKPAL